MIRKGIILVDEFLEYVGIGVIHIFGCRVAMNSIRYKVFKQKGITCCSCGIKAKFAALERHRNNGNKKKFHFNLYAVDDNGNEVLMTKDHIIPISKGGKTKLNNLQPMCAICNVEKSNFSSLDEARSNIKLTRKQKRRMLPNIDINKDIIGLEVCKKSGKKFQNGNLTATIEKIGTLKITSNNKPIFLNAVKLTGLDEMINIRTLTNKDARDIIFSWSTKNDMLKYKESHKNGDITENIQYGNNI